jgi:hypothetical protein
MPPSPRPIFNATSSTAHTPCPRRFLGAVVRSMPRAGARYWCTRDGVCRTRHRREGQCRRRVGSGRAVWHSIHPDAPAVQGGPGGRPGCRRRAQARPRGEASRARVTRVMIRMTSRWKCLPPCESGEYAVPLRAPATGRKRSLAVEGTRAPGQRHPKISRRWRRS